MKASAISKLETTNLSAIRNENESIKNANAESQETEISGHEKNDRKPQNVEVFNLDLTRTKSQSRIDEDYDKVVNISQIDVPWDETSIHRSTRSESLNLTSSRKDEMNTPNANIEAAEVDRISVTPFTQFDSRE